MAVTSFKRSRIRAGLNKYDSMLVGNTQYVDNVNISGGLLSADSTYYYRTFPFSGTLTVSGGAVAVDILVISGGGAGDEGGGGAGGLLGFMSQALATGSYAVTVGAGGSNPSITGGGNNSATSGSNSAVAGLSTTVVGGGAGRYTSAGISGGSGGGGGNGSAGGAGTSGQGNNGGASYGLSSGGGGGGAGSAGSASPSLTTGGAGGAGSSSYSSWGLATGTGHNVSGTVYYAGGGGGGCPTGGTPGAGGNGGGGAGASGSAASGTANTGSGGGGIYQSYPAGNGGSGIVIVRYLKTAVQATQTDFELIGTIELTSAQSSVTFTGLPSEYKHLQIRAVARGTQTTGGEYVNVRLNGDSTTNYWQHGMETNLPSSVSSYNSNTNTTAMFQITNGADTANAFGSGIIDLTDAFSSTKNKTLRGIGGISSSVSNVALRSGLWLSAATTTSITIHCFSGSTFAANSRFSLYGLRG